MFNNTFDESNLETPADIEETRYTRKKKKSHKQSIDDYYRDMEIERIIARQEGLELLYQRKYNVFLPW